MTWANQGRQSVGGRCGAGYLHYLAQQEFKRMEAVKNGHTTNV